MDLVQTSRSSGVAVGLSRVCPTLLNQIGGGQIGVTPDFRTHAIMALGWTIKVEG